MNADEKILQEALGTLPIKITYIPEVDFMDFLIDIKATIHVNELLCNELSPDKTFFIFEAFLQPGIALLCTNFCPPNGSHVHGGTVDEAIRNLCEGISGKRCYYPVTDHKQWRKGSVIDVPKLKYTPISRKNKSKNL